MKIQQLTPEAEILAELGRRLALVRKQQRFSQVALAEEAGLGVATLRRIEAGQDSQMESWLKILKAMHMSSSIEQLLPEQLASPMAEVQGKTRRTPAKGKKPRGDKTWGDQQA